MYDDRARPARRRAATSRSGDRLDIDVAGARRAGIDSALVLTRRDDRGRGRRPPTRGPPTSPTRSPRSCSADLLAFGPLMARRPSASSSTPAPDAAARRGSCPRVEARAARRRRGVPRGADVLARPRARAGARERSSAARSRRPWAATACSAPSRASCAERTACSASSPAGAATTSRASSASATDPERRVRRARRRARAGDRRGRRRRRARTSGSPRRASTPTCRRSRTRRGSRSAGRSTLYATLRALRALAPRRTGRSRSTARRTRFTRVLRRGGQLRRVRRRHVPGPGRDARRRRCSTSCCCATARSDVPRQPAAGVQRHARHEPRPHVPARRARSRFRRRPAVRGLRGRRPDRGAARHHHASCPRALRVLVP